MRDLTSFETLRHTHVGAAFLPALTTQELVGETIIAGLQKKLESTVSYQLWFLPIEHSDDQYSLLVNLGDQYCYFGGTDESQVVVNLLNVVQGKVTENITPEIIPCYFKTQDSLSDIITRLCVDESREKALAIIKDEASQGDLKDTSKKLEISAEPRPLDSGQYAHTLTPNGRHPTSVRQKAAAADALSKQVSAFRDLLKKQKSSASVDSGGGLSPERNQDFDTSLAELSERLQQLTETFAIEEDTDEAAVAPIERAPIIIPVVYNTETDNALEITALTPETLSINPTTGGATIVIAPYKLSENSFGLVVIYPNQDNGDNNSGYVFFIGAHKLQPLLRIVNTLYSNLFNTQLGDPREIFHAIVINSGLLQSLSKAIVDNYAHTSPESLHSFLLGLILRDQAVAPSLDESADQTAADGSLVSHERSALLQTQRSTLRSATRQSSEQHKRLKLLEAENEEQITQLTQELRDKEENIRLLHLKIEKQSSEKLLATDEIEDVTGLSRQLSEKEGRIKNLEADLQRRQQQLEESEARYQTLLSEKEKIAQKLAALERKHDSLRPFAETSAIAHRTMMSTTMGTMNRSVAAAGGMSHCIEEALNESMARDLTRYTRKEKTTRHQPSFRTVATPAELTADTAEEANVSFNEEYETFQRQEAILRSILGLAALSYQLMFIINATASMSYIRETTVTELERALIELSPYDILRELTAEAPKLQSHLTAEQKEKLVTPQSSSTKTFFSGMFGSGSRAASPAPEQLLQSTETMAKGVTKLRTMRQDLLAQISLNDTTVKIKATLSIVQSFITTNSSLEALITTFRRAEGKIKNLNTSKASNTLTNDTQKEQLSEHYDSTKLNITTHIHTTLPALFSRACTSIASFFTTIQKGIESALLHYVTRSNLTRHALAEYFITSLADTYKITGFKPIDCVTTNTAPTEVFDMLNEEMLASLEEFCSTAWSILESSSNLTEQELRVGLMSMRELLPKLRSTRSFVLGTAATGPGAATATTSVDMKTAVQHKIAANSDTLLPITIIHAAHTLELALINTYGYASKQGPNNIADLQALKQQFLENKTLKTDLEAIPTEQLNVLVFDLLKKCCEDFVQGESLLNALCISMQQLPALYRESLSQQAGSGARFVRK